MLPALIEAETTGRLAARRQTIASGFKGDPDPAVLDWLVGRSLQMPSWAAVACYETMLTADLVDEVPNVTLPVLQVRGERDPVNSGKGARWLAERLRDTRLVELPDCGHYPMFEAPAAFDAALLPFVTGI
jgi:pimeloyl-ACP methyl ester carboxylesterase